MRFTETRFEGAWLIELDLVRDERGFNARAWCEREFRSHGITTLPRQTNIIANPRRGTLRGMHWQEPPHAESKLFRVTRGAMYDVIVDLRPGSDTYGEWQGFELAADDYVQLYVPPCFAQGFQTLTDDHELAYQVSEFYTPSAGHGFRFDDPAFGIEWPLPVSVISEKDASWAPLTAADQESPS
jgi:dTDP-4-dehydrorhamnose 3,5-epimerase